jgi:hypothetical protein
MTERNPFSLASELARPVAAGTLHPQEAKAALLVQAIRRRRPDDFDLSLFLFRQQLRRERIKRAVAAHQAAMERRWQEKRHG